MCEKPVLARFESIHHQVDHRDVDHALTAVGRRLIVFAQPTVFAQPRKRALDDPAFGQHLERVARLAFDDLDHAAERTLGPAHQFAGVAAVGLDQLQAREPADHVDQHVFGAVAILNVGRVHHRREDQAERVDNNMPLSSRDFLARVVAAIPPFPAVLTD